MKKIAVYGKGGIGKSTISACISVAYAMSGRKVLHIGCDPKHDSTVSICGNTRPVTIAELLLVNQDKNPPLSSFMVRGRYGIDCVEAGGPMPGVGCGGRGIARMLEIFEDYGLLESGYDLALFDVLGDVVCGGFAGPLKYGYADSVAIVTSEEVMSLYAANNICRAVERFSRSGVVLAGLIVNRRNNEASLDIVNEFAEMIGSRILCVVPRDVAVSQAEIHGQTVVEFAPESPAAQSLLALADEFQTRGDELRDVPKPISENDFYDFIHRYRDKPVL